jgi:hypothetical protein
MPDKGSSVKPRCACGYEKREGLCTCGLCLWVQEGRVCAGELMSVGHEKIRFVKGVDARVSLMCVVLEGAYN